INYSDYPMLSSKNVFFDSYNYNSPRYLSKADFELENRRTQISDGDVLLTIVGTVGRTCCVQKPFIPFTLQRSVAVLKPKHDFIVSRFLMYTLHSLSELWNQEAKGAAQKGIYLKQLSLIPIFAPSLSEQEAIVERLDGLSERVKKLEEIARTTVKECDALKQSILRETFE
ncbi:MAG: restriction endonuclease subunit S, partial [Muribaculaceae bacterium]|nr:restriction endonuclease subunit S [Muribaculaceae bacterium]